ncbi:MAG: SpaA isopeptide-forming pilin-related protein [Eubacteriales bacterium]|nr:SpaA isopeptide-forming pilin-related protein [Eubacteriales bacterium]
MRNAKTRASYAGRSWIRIILAMLITAVMMPLSLPEQSSAAEAGDTGTVAYTNVCRDIDGEKYYFHGDHFMGGARERYYLKVDGGKDMYCFCIEYDKALPQAGTSLTAYENASYWKTMSRRKRQGITLAALYGFGGVATGFGQGSVSAGIEELKGKVTTDDLWLATQQIIWEYQTGDRTSPTAVEHSRTKVPWDGTKSHKSFMTAYRWILAQMAAHTRAWSFAAREQENAPVTLMKWTQAGTYAAYGVKDSSRIGRGVTSIEPAGLSIKAQQPGGDLYDFTGSTGGTKKQVYTMQKDFGGRYSKGSVESALVWNTGSRADQWMYTGTSDCIDFYAAVRNEAKGKLSFTKYYTVSSPDRSGAKGSRTILPEDGAVFEVYNEKYASYKEAKASPFAEAVRLTADENGEVAMAEDQWLTAGTYRIVQVKSREGSKMLDPFTLTIREDGQTARPEASFVDDEIRMQLQIVKVDADTGKTVRLSHASFRLKDSSGSYVKQKYYDEDGRLQETTTFETGAKGSVLLPEPLRPGLYQLEEIKAPDGYLLQKKPLPVIVGKDGEVGEQITVIDDSLLRCRFPDKARKGKITVRKTGDQFCGIKAEKEDGRTVVTPVFQKDGLEGVTFEIAAGEDIKDPADGSILYEAGSTVARMTTNDAGYAESEALPLGRYLLVETEVPEGYAAPAQETVQLDEENMEKDEDIVVEHREIVNDYQPVEVQLKKVVERVRCEVSDDGEYEKLATSMERIPGEGFVFGLYTAQAFDHHGRPIDDRAIEKDENSEGTPLIKKDQLMMTAVSDEEGKIVFRGTIPHGKYYVKEIGHSEKYLDNEQIIHVDLSARTGEAVIRVDKEDEPFVNYLEHDKVKITKTNITGQEPVPGARVEVYDEEEHVVYRDETDEDGSIEGILLEPGEYSFQETLAPQGYAIEPKRMKFTVAANGVVDVQEQEFRDDYANYSLRKTDSDGKALVGAEFGLYKDDKLIDKQTSGEDGLVTFTKIENGSYEVAEIAAPEGYERSEKTLKFEIDGTWANQNDKEIETFENKKVPEAKEEEKESREVPKTGDERRIGTLLFLLLFAAAIGSLAAAVSFRKKNRSDDRLPGGRSR